MMVNNVVVMLIGSLVVARAQDLMLNIVSMMVKFWRFPKMMITRVYCARYIAS